MGKVGNVVFEPELACNSTTEPTSVQEWQQMAIQPDSSRTFMTRGTSVRRRGADGLLTYAADYFDSGIADGPRRAGRGAAAGLTVAADDIARYRTTA